MAAEAAVEEEEEAAEEEVEEEDVVEEEGTMDRILIATGVVESIIPIAIANTATTAIASPASQWFPTPKRMAKREPTHTPSRKKFVFDSPRS